MLRIVTTLVVLIAVVSSSCGNESKGTENETKEEANNLVLDSIYTAEHFDPDRIYSSIGLFKDSLPFMKPGQTLDQLPEWFDYREDPNADYWEHYEVVVDYLSIPEEFRVELEDGSVNGIMFFSAGQKDKKIF